MIAESSYKAGLPDSNDRRRDPLAAGWQVGGAALLHPHLFTSAFGISIALTMALFLDFLLHSASLRANYTIAAIENNPQTFYPYNRSTYILPSSFK